MRYLLFLALFTCSLHAAEMYVSPNGNDSDDGFTPETAFQTIEKADSEAYPGDIIYIMDGDYIVEGWDDIITLKSYGEPKAYITFQAFPGHSPKIVTRAKANTWAAMKILGAFIILDGIELQGHNASLNYDDAMDSYEHAKDGGSDWGRYAIYNTSGIDIGDMNNYPNFKVDHIIIRNCKVHDFPGGGISITNADYITLQNNEVYNNSWYCMYANSGISVITPWNSDTSTDTKIKIVGNTVYNNYVSVPWINTRQLSDGNGIIVDVNLEGSNGRYTGKTLVANNLVFDNGGGGLTAFKASGVDVINNTFYKNCKVMTDWGDIFANQGENYRVINNICYARDGGMAFKIYKTPDLENSNNLYFNGSVSKGGENYIIDDPLFKKATIDASIADFELQNTSPAIDSGIAHALTDTVDIAGNPRIRGQAIDRGCYESGFDTQVESTTPLQFSLTNFPNPFNPTTTIRYQIPNTSHVVLKIYDIRGKLIDTLTDRIHHAGTYTVSFDAGRLASGAYLCLLETDQWTQTRKLLLVH